MKIIPGRHRDSLLPRATDLEEMWHRIVGNGERGLSGQLPEVFRQPLLPPVNVVETEDSFCVTMDCPGMTEADFDVEAMGNQLLISGERKWEDESKGAEFRRVESSFGKFERTIRLPENARTNAQEMEAKYATGILTITIPKRERTPTSKIPVRAE